MPSVFRKGDSSVGHGYPPMPCQTGSPNVYVNNKEVVRVQDVYGGSHSYNSSNHAVGAAGVGSSTVFVNNLAVHRTGDAVNCGDVAGLGSPDVICG